MKNISDISIKYMIRNKKTTILTVLSIMTSVAMLVMISTGIMNIRDLMIYENNNIEGVNDAIYHRVPMATVDKLKLNVDIEDVAVAKQVGIVTKFRVGDMTYPLEEYIPNFDEYLEGVNPKIDKMERLLSKVSTNIEKVGSNLISYGRFPTEVNELVIKTSTADRMGYSPKLGDILEVEYQIIDKKTTDTKHYKLVGIIDDSTNLSGINLESFLTGLGSEKEGEFDAYVFIKGKQVDVTKIYKIAEKMGLSPEQASAKSSLDSSGFSSIMLVVTFVGLIFIGVLLITTFGGIFTVFNLSYSQRQRQYGLIKAIGASDRQIRNINRKEILLLSLLAIPLGIIIGNKIIAYLFNNPQTNLFSLFGYSKFRSKTYIEINFLAFFISYITVSFSIFFASSRKSNESAVDLIRNSEFGGSKVRKRKYRLTKFFLGFDGYMARRNIDRTMSKFVLSSMSIAVTITIFIGSIYVTRLVSDVYQNRLDYEEDINYRQRAPEGSLSLEGLGELGAFKEIDSIISFYTMAVSVDAPIEKENFDVGRKLTYQYYDKYKITIYDSRLVIMSLEDIKKSYNISNEDLAKMRDEKRALVFIENYNGIDKQNFIGNRIGVNISQNNYFQIDVLKADIGLKKLKPDLPNGVTVLVAKEFFEDSKYIPAINQHPQTVNIYTKEGMDNSELLDYLRLDKQVKITNNKEIRRQVISRIDGVISYVYIIAALMAFVSATNIINSISINIINREKELALLSALGMSNSGFMRMMWIESVSYNFIGSILGFIFSLGLTNFLQYVIFRSFYVNPVMNFSYNYPFLDYFYIVFTIILLVFVTCLLNMRRIILKGPTNKLRG